MNKDWEILTLGGYLKEKVLHGEGTTFIRTLPETEECPEITVGLGIISQQRTLASVSLMPQPRHSRVVMVNALISEVAEKYLQLSDQYPDNWQEVLLLDLGYANKNLNRFPASDDYKVLHSIAKEERIPLYKKFGFHKIATLVAYGVTEKFEDVLSSLDELNKTLPHSADYGKLMSLMNNGVPAEDLHLAIDLPDDMLTEFYND